MVPNGGRVYYSRRSQPPLLTQMVDLVYNTTGDRSLLQLTLPSLLKEYQFWMEQRMVGVAGHTLNRYAVNMSTPRPESYREDLSTAADVPTGEALPHALSVHTHTHPLSNSQWSTALLSAGLSW